MDTAIGLALLKVRTSNQWSLANAVAKKMEVPTPELEVFLAASNEEELRVHGVWAQKIGKCWIVCTNPGYRRAIEEGSTCNCASGKDSGNGSEEAMKRYFGSSDYNAGRHGRDPSKGAAHHPSCPGWSPPTEGHLHSWRRGY
eukprot:3608142-Rhodomonas_salina.2